MGQTFVRVVRARTVCGYDCEVVIEMRLCHDILVALLPVKVTQHTLRIVLYFCSGISPACQDKEVMSEDSPRPWIA
jgi:hypothetical protein